MMQRFMQSTKGPIALTAFLYSCYALYCLWLQLTDRFTTPFNFWVNVLGAAIYFFSSVVAWYCYKNAHDPAYRRMYGAWAIGMAIWSLGLLIWSYYNIVLKVSIPFPSLSDVFFIAYYAFMGYGTLKLQQLSNDKNQLPILASLPVVIISFVMVLFIFNRPDLSSEVPLLQRTISVGYSLGDALLLSMTLVALQNSAILRLKTAIYYIIGSFLVMLAADFTFFYTTAQETYYNGNISDVLYGLFPALLIVGLVKLYASSKGQDGAPPPAAPLYPPAVPGSGAQA